ncbi:glutamate 5-kinase [Leptotrichia buccalis]|uniref:Glutamate 5-kinase n=1 Tax=Leptotrichia buccalis (strain ATCC 14201 / DSM 1135 / JCM 12969 / NCTC 10249 / C-1013-b) TaxID=523794 RepID=C7ND32_LEPBD|nr:glutamate 5-kinase [Leptotrichia buccalis]ACV39910.1 glutamate 5-kinase [Leptotrichia buccalis C-1013-b]
MKNRNTREEILENIQRIVVKVGTSTLTNENGHLDIEKIRKIVLELSNLQDKGYDVILVSSGAVGAGMGLLNINEKPKTLAEKQMLSAVGQVSLMQIYQTLFKEHNKIVGQLLLTKEEFSNRKRYLNMRNVCNAFLKRKIIPIINENDAIVSNALKIKVGDNDTMSALVSGLIDADLLIILSDIDGLYNKNPRKYEDANLIHIVGDINEDIKKMAGAEGSKFGTGGMVTKIIAAEMVTKIGTSLVIASGDEPKNITRIVEKENIGTLFVKKNKKISLRKYWLAYGPSKEGALTIDNGAKSALKNGKSLLSVGIKSVEGTFDKGAIVEIEDLKGKVIATGISNYSSEEINLIKGEQSENIEEILGYKYDDAVIHIDNVAMKK